VRSQYLSKEADTNFIAANQVQQSQPRVIRESAKAAIHAEMFFLSHALEIVSHGYMP